MYKNIRISVIKVVPFTKNMCYNKSGSVFMQKYKPIIMQLGVTT